MECVWNFSKKKYICDRKILEDRIVAHSISDIRINSNIQMKKFLYLLSALVLSACAGEKTVPVLHVEGGDIQGVTTEKEGVYVYKGIPYAAPPIG